VLFLEFTHFSTVKFFQNAVCHSRSGRQSFSKENSEVLINGYHGCMVAACRIGGRKTIPLALRLWSSRAPGFKGENDEVLNIVKSVYDATGGKVVMVYDRGGDRPAFRNRMDWAKRQTRDTSRTS
jgi:hypothetical protein